MLRPERQGGPTENDFSKDLKAATGFSEQKSVVTSVSRFKEAGLRARQFEVK